MKKNNEKGTILQVTLVLLLIVTTSVLGIAKIVVENRRSLQRIEIVDEQRRLELYMLADSKVRIKNERIENYQSIWKNAILSYHITKQEDAYSILVDVEREDIAFTCTYEISSELIVSNFEYQ